MRAIVIAGTLALAGCQTVSQPGPPAATAEYKPLPDAQAMDAAKRALMAALKDPESARLGPMRRHNVTDAMGRRFDVVCGTVNSKNSFGGYTGAQPFAYNLERGTILIAEGSMREVNAIAVTTLCGG
jgi:hypothetical protein